MKYLKTIITIGVLALASACGSLPVNNAVAVSNVAPAPAGSSPIASPSPTSQASPSANDEAMADPAARLIREYYAAINAGDFRKAYSLWDGDGRASKQTLEQFSSGFASTAGTNVEIGKPTEPEGAAGSQYITVPVKVRANLKDGTEQRFEGKYVLRRSMVEGAEHRGEWRIYSAKIRKR